MWALLPVKRLENAKLRLAGILTPAQRRRLSCCMVEDILSALGKSTVISGVTVVSCDESVISLAQDCQAAVLNTGVDHGYSADVLKGIEALSDEAVDKALVIPADVPELDPLDLAYLNRIHKKGITLSPADNDGGTNGLVFTPPLAIGLRYGEDSLTEFCKEAKQRQVPANIARADGLARDLDRPEDLLALQRQPKGNRTWRYVKSLAGITNLS